MKKASVFILICLLVLSCKKKEEEKTTTPEKLRIVTTTTMITDLLKQIGGDDIIVDGLMGTGVDPHLYKASEGDVNKLFEADAVFYNGLHLEGKLEEIFEKMKHQNKTTIAIADAIGKNLLISSENFASNYDPHIWFNIDYWKKCTAFVVGELSKLDQKNATNYRKRGTNYIKQLGVLSNTIKQKVLTLPTEKRILVTAHDAFNYFGKAYQFDVVGLQGLSTATEAGVKDVQNLANFIIEKKVKAIFVESSVPKKTIEALQEAVNAKNHDVQIGGTLYSDALGNPDTKEGNYIGMFQYNTETIINALQ